MNLKINILSNILKINNSIINKKVEKFINIKKRNQLLLFY